MNFQKCKASLRIIYLIAQKIYVKENENSWFLSRGNTEKPSDR